MRPFDPRVLRLAPRARGPLVALAAIGTVSGVLAIAQAFAVAAVIVAVVGVADGTAAADRLWHAVVVAAVVFVARGAAAAAGEVVAARTAALVSGGLRARYVAALLAARIDARPPAAAATTLAVQGAASIEPYVARYLPTLVSAAVLPPAAVLAMAWLDLPTALVPVLTLPLLPLFAALIGSATADATARRWRTLAALSGHFLDVVRGLPTLVAYGRATRQVSTIAKVSDDHRRATVATLRIAFLSSGALELLATLSVAVVAVWTGIHLAAGSMRLDVALPLILLAPEAYWPIRRVGAEFHAAADGAQALDDLSAALDRLEGGASAGAHGPEVGDGPAATRGAADPGTAPGAADPGAAPSVTLRGLTYRYTADGPDVAAAVDADLPVGLTAVVGPSGAGKTTFLELVAGLRTPTSGTVVAPRAHLVTQRPFLAPGTLADNLRLGARADASDADLLDALATVGLHGLVAGPDPVLPDGLATVLGDDGFGLSAGQRARVAVARALLDDAAVVLLDEPTAHLDADAQATIHDVVRTLAATRVVLAVTHRDELVALADRVVEITPATSATVSAPAVTDGGAGRPLDPAGRR